MRDNHIDIIDITIMNWGAFNGLFPNISLNDNYIGINGKNQSGKTSFTDALFSCFIPEKSLPLGGASSENTKKGDRTYKSYVNGLLPGKINSNDEYLREPGSISMNMLNAIDRKNDIKFSFGILIQVLESRDIKKTFFIRKSYSNMKGEDAVINFNSSLNFIEIKKSLQEKGFQFYDNFKSYKETLYRKLNLDQSKINLMLNTINKKEIKDIDSFVKEILIKNIKYKEICGVLVNSSHDLNTVDNQIKIESNKLELLENSGISLREYEKVITDIDKLKGIKENIVFLRKHKMIPVLDKRIYEDNKNLEVLSEDIVDLEDRSNDLDLKIEEISISINSSDRQRDISEKKRRLFEYESQIKDIKERRNSYFEVLNELKINKNVNSIEKFNNSKKAIESINEKYLDNTNSLEEDKFRLLGDINILKKEKSLLEKRIEIIEKNNTTLSADTVLLQNKLETNIEGISVDFLFNHINIKEGEWDLAFEKRLRSYEDVLLIDEKYEEPVFNFLTKNEITARFIIIRSQKNTSLETLNFKGSENILIKNNSPCEIYAFLNDIFKHKVLHKGNNRFPVNSLSNKFGHREGNFIQIDFSLKYSDLDAYYLTNIENIKAKLKEELKYVLLSLKGKDKCLEEIKNNLKNNQYKMRLIANIEYIKNFKDIDVDSIIAIATEIKDEIKKLEREEEYILVLKEKRKILKKTRDKALEDIGSKKGEVSRLSSELTFNSKQLESFKKDTEDFNIGYLENIFNDITKELKVKKTSLDSRDSIDEYFNNVNSSCESRIRVKEGLKITIERNASNAVIKLVKIDSQEYENISLNSDSLDKIKILSEKLEILKKQRIPDLHKKWREYINDDLTLGLEQLKNTITFGLENCREQADSFNKYVENSFNGINLEKVFLEINDHKSLEIKRFDRELNSLIPDLSIGYNDEYAKKLTSFTNKLKDENFIERCINPLNRVKFAVKKGDRVYTDSKSFSGGQRIELCYFILAASYSMIFKLESVVPTLRLMIIDEISMKLDSENIKKSLNIFTSLDVQLMAIEPEANFDILSMFVDKIVTIHKNEDRKTSGITVNEKVPLEA